MTGLATLAPGLDKIVSQFPVLAQQINGAALAYLDNAATTQVPRSVTAAMLAFEEHDRANIHRGVHTLSQRATDLFEDARERVKRFLHAGQERELVFTSGTTDALNMLAQGMCFSVSGEPLLQAGDEIIVSGLEHHANLIPWRMAARRTGAKLRFLMPDAEGVLHVEALQALLSDKTRVLALTACANATGYCPPLKPMLKQAAELGAMTVIDAAQVVGHGSLDASELNCDFAVFSAHKMYGPMGMGGLLGRRKLLDRLGPLRFGGDMVDWVTLEDAGFKDVPTRLEGGTPNVTAAIGMAAAADFISSLPAGALGEHLSSLREHAVKAISTLPGVRVLNPGPEAEAIVSFVVDGVHPHDIGTFLDQEGVAVRTGHHCAQPLLTHLGLNSTTRASFAIYNSHEQVDGLVSGVKKAIKALR